MADQVPDRELSTKSTNRVLQHVAADEPIFVLRGRDVFAPMFVRLWAQALACTVDSLNAEIPLEKIVRHLEERLAQALPVPQGVEPLKATQAMDLAAQMDNWQPKKLPD